MRKSFPTRLTESFNEGIYNTKPLKDVQIGSEQGGL